MFGLMLALGVGGALIAWAANLYASPERAPAVTFNTIDGERIRTTELLGKVVYVSFWSTSCVSCLAEMPMLTKTHERYARRGYETMAVAMSYDRADYVMQYARSRQLPFKVVLDLSEQVATAFEQTTQTPTGFLIDRKGRIVRRFVGTPESQDLEAAIETALRS